MNMKPSYKIAKEYVEKGLLSCRADQNDPNIEVFCYSKACFFSKDSWDDVTLSHRGAVYYKGQPVNRPLTKIFNVGEVEATNVGVIEQRMKTEEYEVFHKANGHLFIVSIFPTDEGHKMVMSTKGSLPNDDNELLNADIELFRSTDTYRKLVGRMDYFSLDNQAITLMFEVIAEHDRHTMYDQEVERYGNGAFVLLGGFSKVGGRWSDWIEYSYSDLTRIAQVIKCPVVDKFHEMEGDFHSWYDHQDTEGYVIRFKNGDRVKIKTIEYWKLRSMKDLSFDNVIQMFRKASDERIILKLPEELAYHIIDIIEDIFVAWLEHDFIKIDEIDKKWYEAEDKEIALSKTLTKEQKVYIFSVVKAKNEASCFKRSQPIRRRFCEEISSCDWARTVYNDRIADVINNLGE